MAPPPDLPRRTTLASLFWLTGCCAAGLAAGPTNVSNSWEPTYDYFLAWLAFIAAAMAVGLAQQAWSLRNAEVPPNCRFGLQHAIAWRAGLAALLALLLLVAIGQGSGVIVLPESEAARFQWRPLLPDAVLVLSVMCGVGLSWNFAPNGGGKLTTLLGCVAGGGWLLFLVRDLAFVPWLVYIAINGIKHAQPALWTQPEAYTEPGTLENYFWLAALALAFLFVGVALLAFARGIRHERATHFSVAFAAASLAVSAGLTTWFYTEALPRFSPEYAEASWRLAWPASVGAASLVGLVSVSGATRLARLPKPDVVVALPACFHETWWVATAVALVVTGSGSTFAYGTIAVGWETRTYNALQTIAYLFADPNQLLGFAGWLLAIGWLRRWWRERKGAPTITIAPLDRRRFVVGGLTLIAIQLVAVPTLTVFALCYWFNPWWP